MNANEERKAKLRNFTFVESADRRLVELKRETGKDMTLILEDLLLGRRQLSPQTEQFLQSEIERTGHSRNAIIESALANYKAKGSFLAAVDKSVKGAPEAVRPNTQSRRASRKSRQG